MLLKGTVKTLDFKGNYAEILLEGTDDVEYFFSPLELVESGLKIRKYDKVTFTRDKLYKQTLVAMDIKVITKAA